MVVSCKKKGKCAREEIKTLENIKEVDDKASQSIGYFNSKSHKMKQKYPLPFTMCPKMRKRHISPHFAII